jgi:hypothetical protein
MQTTLLFISDFDVLSMREAKGDDHRNTTISLSIHTNINTVSVPLNPFSMPIPVVTQTPFLKLGKRHPKKKVTLL